MCLTKINISKIQAKKVQNDGGPRLASQIQTTFDHTLILDLILSFDLINRALLILLFIHLLSVQTFLPVKIRLSSQKP